MSNTTYELVASLRGDRLKATHDIIYVIFSSYDRDIKRSYERLRNPYLQAHHASLAAERKARMMKMFTGFLLHYSNGKMGVYQTK